MAADPTPLGRREVEAVTTEDGWTACGGCSYRFGFRVAGTDEESRVKCPNARCGAWVKLPPRLRERVSRRL